MADKILLDRLTEKERQALSLLVLTALHRPQLLDSTANQHPHRLTHILRQTFNVLKQQT